MHRLLSVGFAVGEHRLGLPGVSFRMQKRRILKRKKSFKLGPMFGGIKLDAKCMVMLVGILEFSNKSALMLVWVGFIYNDPCSKQSLKETGVLFRAPTVPCGTKKTYPPPQRGRALWKTEVLSSPRIGTPRKHGFPKLFFQNEI